MITVTVLLLLASLVCAIVGAVSGKPYWGLAAFLLLWVVVADSATGLRLSSG